MRIGSVFGLTACCCVLLAIVAIAQQPVTLTVRVDQPGAKIDPIFYGLMTEEINFSYDGGLYAELIRNRTMRDDAQNPAHWSVVNYGGSEATIGLEDNPVPNTALTKALRLNAASLAPKQRAGIAAAPDAVRAGWLFPDRRVPCCNLLARCPRRQARQIHRGFLERPR